MANTNYNNDTVHTNTFTPREYQVELLERAKRRNIIICSSTSSSKSFLAIKLVQELACQMRSPNGKRAFYIVNPSNTVLLSEHIRSLTDLDVIALDGFYPKITFLELLNKYAVFVMSLEVCVQILGGCMNGDMSSLNLLVIDDGLYGERESCIQQIMNMYLENRYKPRIVGLVSGLLSEKMMPNYLEGEMVRLESMLQASIDTSSDISALIRVGRPKELLVSCNNPADNSLLNEIRELIVKLDSFLEEHRYDPSEIYDEEFLEEFRNIPDPKMIPKDLLKDFLQILDEFGVWGGNQAALQILILIEKLKVKVAYERHYLLLCVLSTTMLSVRALCDEVIPQVCTSEDIMKWTTSKVHRLIEILKVMGPGERPDVEESPVEFLEPPGGKYGRKNYKGQRKQFYLRNQLEDSICCLIFVSNTLMAKVLHSLISTLSTCDPALWWVGVLYTVDKTANPQTESREAEQEHRRQEEVLRKFRAHECNIMIATSVLEQGFDLPKCNLVIKFDVAKNFHSYIQTKARARALFSYYVSLFYKHTEDTFMHKYSQFMEVENILLKRSNSLEPGTSNISTADTFCKQYAPYITKENESVHLTTAIQIINRYCAKLPSDTFTKLVPNCIVNRLNEEAHCCLRLPINSPVKETVQTKVYENAVIAKRHAAFYMVQLLHKSNELDDFLNPITKEKFNATDEDWNDFSLEKEDEYLTTENIDQRPGTTKRRQYYYKRVADTLQRCMPQSKTKTYFYTIVMTLTCPIPEEQNTRGRKIYPPEDSIQGFGILTSKEIPQICPFPIFTRSGEVKVSLELCEEDVYLTDDEIHKIKEFLNYTFTSVLRLQKYQMLFDPLHSQNSYFIVPTIKDENSVNIDWKFLDLIYSNRDVLPESIPDEDRADYIFDPSQYKDAVVMPWYRNQDQPQYFYVAEICNNLNPASAFPGSEYATFEEYYNRKYGIQIRNKEQHLLDVDHTSARLNFLTPRYVNRKGVALPTSSEETKRAKRENLEQKQILVPELCAIHPFPASLWRKAVCLPCVLYRINALLLADQIRRKVAQEISLGKQDLPRSFTWDPLNFGWSLSDVLKKSKSNEDSKIPEISEEATEVVKYILDDILLNVEIATEIPIVCTDTNSAIEQIKTVRFDDATFVAEEDKTWIEIGTWSNDMIETAQSTTHTSVRYGSPTSWVHSTYGYNEYDDFSDSDTYYSSDDDTATESQCGGLHIEFQGEYLAEAVETSIVENKKSHDLMVTKAWDNVPNVDPEYNSIFIDACNSNFEKLKNESLVHPEDTMDAFFSHRKCEQKEQVNDHGTMTVAEYLPKKCFTKPAQIKTRPNLSGLSFSFDMQPNLEEHPGPSPSVILQALTMSNANDGINLERLETIGDSFLKYAITDYLYSKYCNTHEGKLSHLRSKQVSNLNLYRLGKRKQLGELMIASKFDPHDNWLPPCYCVSKELEEAVNKTRIQGNYLTLADYVSTRNMSLEQICSKIREEGENIEDISEIPYDLVTQHSIPDKSIADCVEALIGAYLIECGPRGALLFMAWLGIRVLPKLDDDTYGELPIPDSPLLQHVSEPDKKLDLLLDGYDKFEKILGYNFNDRSYLLQALTHASYFPNEITDCYQRLEFLGDAVLDYLITRHLYEDQRMHSPGALTDLRSALVNNTIFASLSVKYNFHKYFRYLSPGLHQVIEKFIRIQEEMGHKVSEELFLLDIEENDEVEDIEVPKVLGDIFESVAGAIFLDSGRSLDAVWKVYYGMMKAEIEQFSDKVPKSPIRELLELEPETAKFGPAEKLADGRRVRVAVEVFGKGVFRGIGRNYRIAKCTAAKCALKHLKKQSYPNII